MDAESKQLIKTTHESLMKAIGACKPGARFRDMGDIITSHVQRAGCGRRGHMQGYDAVQCDVVDWEGEHLLLVRQVTGGMRHTGGKSGGLSQEGHSWQDGQAQNRALGTDMHDVESRQAARQNGQPAPAAGFVHGQLSSNQTPESWVHQHMVDALLL